MQEDPWQKKKGELQRQMDAWVKTTGLIPNTSRVEVLVVVKTSEQLQASLPPFKIANRSQDGTSLVHRPLNEDEVKQILSLPFIDVEKKLITLLIENDNRPLTREQLIANKLDCYFYSQPSAKLNKLFRDKRAPFRFRKMRSGSRRDRTLVIAYALCMIETKI